MSLLALKLPPGVVKPGTVYDAKGRWYDANLVRWNDAAMQPVGPWRAIGTVDGPVRGMITWRANDGRPYAAFGTPSSLWVLTADDELVNVTPSGFVGGSAHSTAVIGNYGAGLYGRGLYGRGDPNAEGSTEAQTWQLDTFGQYLIAQAYSDGKLYYWDPSSGGLAQQLSDSPTDCAGVVVTPERFVVALGAGGDPRLVKWADQESLSTWTPSSENQAGDLTLSTNGIIMAGARTKRETLIWTDVGLHALRYIGGTLVYGIDDVATNCGLIARLAKGIVSGRAIWMGQRGFYAYDGYVQPVPCDVADYVFGSLNRAERSQIACDVRSDFNEVTWYYPSASSIENDRYVTFNYLEGHWTVGELERTSGADRGVYPYPMAADEGGTIYEHEHEEGSYLSPDGDTLTPYAESGPVELGAGDRVMDVLRIIPDEKTNGDVRLSIYSSYYPGETETTHGPFTVAQPTDCRLNGRQVRLRVEQVNGGWRFGTPRLDVVPGGLR